MRIIFFLGLFVILVAIPLLKFILRFFASPKKGKNNYFFDDEKRIVIYHGVNVSNYSKKAEDYLPWHTEEDYKKLKEYGFNIVRFLIFWEAIEPTKGNYNLDYIDKVKSHLSILNNLDIKVMLDLHQDLYSRKFTGNGFPDWTLPEKEYPFKPEKDWYKNYLKKAVRKSYEHFWKNNVLKKCYFDMVRFVNDTFESVPNVIGLDVMNEPFPTLPRFFFFERVILADFYQDIKFSLVGIYKRVPLFFEPGIWTSAGIPSLLIEDKERTWNGYIPHYFPPFCHNKGTYKKFDAFLMKIGLRSRARETQELGSPYITGEFGMGVNVKNRFEGIKNFLDLADKYHISWMWWAFDKEIHSTQGLLDNDGNPNAVMKALSRPYPQKIAGKDPIFYFKKNKFSLEYIDDIGKGLPTKIYIPKEVEGTKKDIPYRIESNMFYISDGKVNCVKDFFAIEKGKQKVEIIWESL